MVDNREAGFLDYNEKNIFKNMLQIEEHLHNLSESDNKLGHAQCINKHSFFVEAELEEAISHATVSSPDKLDTIKLVRKQIIEFRETLSKHSVEENIIIIRNIRKEVEKLNPKLFDTKQCKACGNLDKIFAEMRREIEKMPLKKDIIPSPNTSNESIVITESSPLMERKTELFPVPLPESIDDLLPTAPLQYGLMPPLPQGLAKKVFGEPDAQR